MSTNSNPSTSLTEVDSFSSTDSVRIVPMRLQKFLARAGVASRRGSEDLMTSGRVAVNGVIVTELGSKVDPSVDEVTVDGRPVYLGSGPVYLVLNKPAGFLTTMSDPYDRSCVASLVPLQEYPGLFPVGRLDFDTSGVLLFMTDGDLANQLLHPSHGVVKCYRAVVDGILSDDDLDPLRDGIMLDDGPAAPAVVSLLSDTAGNSVVSCCIHEGRKRQVKRMFEAIGHPVITLVRESFGPITAEGLGEGEWRMLSSEETDALKAAIND